VSGGHFPTGIAAAYACGAIVFQTAETNRAVGSRPGAVYDFEPDSD
jgi:hypothetical protein